MYPCVNYSRYSCRQRTNTLGGKCYECRISGYIRSTVSNFNCVTPPLMSLGIPSVYRTYDRHSDLRVHRDRACSAELDAQSSLKHSRVILRLSSSVAIVMLENEEII